MTIHYTQLIHVCMFWSIIRHLCAKHIGQDGGVMMKINRQHPPLTYRPKRFSKVTSSSQTKLFWITLNKYFWIRNRGYQDQCKRITCCKHHWGRLPGCQGKIEDVGDLRKDECDYFVVSRPSNQWVIKLCLTISVSEFLPKLYSSQGLITEVIRK